jgi:hypothetical protein
VSESTDPSQKPKKPVASEVVPYYSPVWDQKRSSSGGEIALGFGAFWIITILFIMGASRTNISFETGFMLWIVLVIILFAGAIIVGVQREKWGLAKGLLAAVLLTGSLIGLLAAICSGV